MVGKVEPNLGYGVRGWKAKQHYAQMKKNGGKTPQEREKIRAIRKRHKMGPESVEEPVATTEPPIVVPEQDGPEDMDRDALIAELQAAGQTVHPASKDDTLRRKVEELRNG